MRSFNMIPLLFFSTQSSISSIFVPCVSNVMIMEEFPNSNYFGGSYGYIARSPPRGFATTDLCIIVPPPNKKGRCRMHFRNPNYVQQPGSTRVQLFTLGSTAITGATWNQRGTAYRDKQIGTFDVVSGGEAKFEGSDTIDCPTKPSGYELLLTGDNGYVSWAVSSNQKPNGLSLEFL